MNTTEIAALLIFAGIVGLLIWKGGLRWWHALALLAIGIYIGGSSVAHYATSFASLVDYGIHWAGDEISSLKGKPRP